MNVITRALRGARQLGARVRSRGIKEVALLTWSRTKEEISSGETLHFLVKETSPNAPTSDDLSFRAATDADAERYARDVGTDSPQTFRSRLTPRTRCFVVEADDRFVHASWVTTERSWAREIRGWLVPPHGDAYIYESFTHPDARGRGIYPFALASILATLCSEGVRRAWIAVEEHNPPSRRSIDKAGFTFAFAISYRRKLGRFTLYPATGPEAQVGQTFVQAHKGREK